MKSLTMKNLLVCALLLGCSEQNPNLALLGFADSGESPDVASTDGSFNPPKADGTGGGTVADGGEDPTPDANEVADSEVDGSLPRPDATPEEEPPRIQVTYELIDPGSSNPRFDAIVQYVMPGSEPWRGGGGMGWPAGCRGWLGASNQTLDMDCEGVERPEDDGPDPSGFAHSVRGTPVPDPESWQGRAGTPSLEFQSSYVTGLTHSPGEHPEMHPPLIGTIKIAVFTRFADEGTTTLYYPLPTIQITVECGEMFNVFQMQVDPEQPREVWLAAAIQYAQEGLDAAGHQVPTCSISTLDEHFPVGLPQ